MDVLNMVPSMWNNSTAAGQRQFSQRSDVSDCESPSSDLPPSRLPACGSRVAPHCALCVRTAELRLRE